MPRDGDSVLQVTHHADVALRAMGQPNSIARQFDFWDDTALAGLWAQRSAVPR